MPVIDLLSLPRAAARAAQLCLLAGCASAAGAASLPAQLPPASHPAKAHLSVLLSFSRTTGDHPWSGVTLADDGNFYGVTHDDGPTRGTLYRATPAGELQVLHSFRGAKDGVYPSVPPVQGSDGALYGYSNGWGTQLGVLYRSTLDGQFEVLHYFDGQGGPYTIESALMLARDGALYGASTGGGPSGGGTLFKMSNTGELTVLASFDQAVAYAPSGTPLEGDDGSFYLGLQYGGAYHSGALVRVLPDGTIKTLYSFQGTTDDSANPSGPLVYDTAHKCMYGVTAHVDDTALPSTVFRYCGGTFKTIASLPGTSSLTDLSLAPDGQHLYATYANELYAFTPSAKGHARAVVALPGYSDPYAGLVWDADGAMYGTTWDGGANNLGTVYKVVGAP